MAPLRARRPPTADTARVGASLPQLRAAASMTRLRTGETWRALGRRVNARTASLTMPQSNLPSLDDESARA